MNRRTVVRKPMTKGHFIFFLVFLVFEFADAYSTGKTWKNCDDMPCIDGFKCEMKDYGKGLGPICIKTGKEPEKRPIFDPSVDTSELYQRCEEAKCPKGKVCLLTDDQMECAKVIESSCCCSSGQLCVLQPVVCVREPCNPQPTCTEPKPSVCNLLCATGTHCEASKEGPKCVPNSIAPPPGESDETSKLYEQCSAIECSQTENCQLSGGIMTCEKKNYVVKCDCQSNQLCVLQVVQCFTTPCPPIPICTEPESTVGQCAATLCPVNTKCIETKNGAECIPLNPVVSCATILCVAGTTCVDRPGGSGECVQKDQAPTCASTTCLVGNDCIETPDGPKCVPASGYATPPPDQEPPKGTTCANVRCANGPCIDTENGPKCTNNANHMGGGKIKPATTTQAPPVLTCANVLCAPGSIGCIETADGPFCITNETTCADIRCDFGCTETEKGPRCDGDDPNPCFGFPCPPTQECVLLDGGPKCLESCTKPNEILNKCGNLCEPNCKNLDDPIACPLICAPPACVCKEGYYRNNNGDCVSKEECPPKSEPECGKKEEINSCGNLCEPGCKNAISGEPKFCIKICNPPECVCKKDLFRDERSGECLTKKECIDKEPVCGPKEEVNPCGNLCEPECENAITGEGKVCIEICNPPECVCKKGLYRDKKSGKCLTKKQCIKKADESKYSSKENKDESDENDDSGENPYRRR